MFSVKINVDTMKLYLKFITIAFTIIIQVDLFIHVTVVNGI